MALLLTPEQELIKKVVREFAEKELGPEATRIDRESAFPRDHYRRMAPLGLLGMLLPPDQGGPGTDTLSYVVAVEEVARVSGTDAAMLVLTNSLVTFLLHQAATPEQRAGVVEPTLRAERIGACAVAEEASGSSYGEIFTVARRNGTAWDLSGSKYFVGLAGVADYYLLLARAPDAGPTWFLLEKDAPGLHFSQSESKLGLRGLPVAEMYLNHVRLPPDAVVGDVGKGLELIEEPLSLARLGAAAGLVGLTQAALEMSLDFSKKRVQFGKPIASYGAIRGMIADVQADLEAARATTYGAASLRDTKKEFLEEVFEARLLAHRIAVKGTRIAHRIHGGAGFMRDLPLERVSRDVRTLMHLWDAQDITRSYLADLLLR